MKRFLALWLGGLVVLTALVVALNAAVDPYGVLGTPPIPGLTALKSAAADRPRLTKAYLVDRAHARTLLLGASNVDVGMNPESPAFPPADRPVFNLAIDGSLPSVLAAYLRHALAHNDPKLIILGLTLEDSMVMPQKRLGAADAALYAYAQRLRFDDSGHPNPGYLQARLEDALFATLSTQALSDSLFTLLRQHRTDLNLQSPAGHNSGGSFTRWTRDDGAYALVTNKDRDKANNFVLWSTEPQAETTALADIVHLARDHGARLIVFFQPTYVDELEIIRQTGQMPAWLKWKHDAVDAIAAAAGPTPVPIWDFSGYTPYTTEPLPPPGDTAHALTWFWEPIHYRQALGDAMLARMLGTGGPPDLGVQLTPADLPAHQADFARAQAEWEAAHPADIQRVRTIVDAATHDFCTGLPAGCNQGRTQGPSEPQTLSSK